MKKKFENEEFISQEVANISEYQTFDAEELRGIELFSEPFEELRGEELQLQSFVEEKVENKPLDKNKMNERELRNKLNKLNSSSSGSSSSAAHSAAASTAGSVATSIGTTGVLVVGGLLGGSMILDIVDLNNNESDITEIIEIPVIAEDNILLSYYQVNPHIEYHFNEETGIDEHVKVNEIIIFFEDNFQDDYICNIVDLNTNETITYDTNLGYVTFNTREDGLFNYDIQLLDQENVLLDSYSIEVNTVGPVKYYEEVPINYMQTFNDDGTSNFYYTPVIEDVDLSPYTFKTDFKLYDTINDKEVIVNNPTTNISTVGAIEDINEYYDMVDVYLYVIDGNAQYLVNKITELTLRTEKNYFYDLEIDKDLLSFGFYNDVYDDINIDVTYLNHGTTDSFFIAQKRLANGYYSKQYDLSRIDTDVLVEVSTQLELNVQNFENYITTYKGSTKKDVVLTKEFINSYTSSLDLTRLEIAPENSNFSYEGGTIPARLYFDGILLKGDSVTVEIYDATNTLLHSKENITNLNEAIVFYDLPYEEIRVDYKIVNNQQEVLSNSYTTILDDSILSEFSFSMNAPNPGEVVCTYNDDGTSNFYFDMSSNGFSHSPIENDAYYVIEVTRNLDSADNADGRYAGTDLIAIIKNMEGSYYSPIYSAYIVADDGITAYGKYYTTPSGTIEPTSEYIDYVLTEQDADNPNLYYINHYNIYYEQPYEVRLHINGDEEGILIEYVDTSTDSLLDLQIDLTNYLDLIGDNEYEILATGNFAYMAHPVPDNLYVLIQENYEEYLKYATIKLL